MSVSLNGRDPEMDYTEALMIIMNRGTMLLPERRHLVAMYKHIYDLEQEVIELEKQRDKFGLLLQDMHEDLKELTSVR